MSLTGTPEPLRPTSAERMRLHRARRAKGLRCITFEVREAEVEILVQQGLLLDADRDDDEAICRALGLLLDRWLR